MFRLLRLGVLVGLLCLAFTGVAPGAPGDNDNDTIVDTSDNCVGVYNIDQLNFDGDSLGNTCDPTPGVQAGESFTIIYLRDITSGGPLSADSTGTRCQSASLVGYNGGVQSGINTTNCYRRYVTTSLFSPSQTIVFTPLSTPEGCTTSFTSPITVIWNGSGTYGTIDINYLCTNTTTTLVENLRLASVGVGAGKSLADKVALVQSQLSSNNTAGACTTLTGYINEVKAQSGKKITAATATALATQAAAIKTAIGC